MMYTEGTKTKVDIANRLTGVCMTIKTHRIRTDNTDIDTNSFSFLRLKSPIEFGYEQWMKCQIVI
jgi:hypothetical protein